MQGITKCIWTYLPSRARKGNTRHERVVKIRNVDPEIVERHSLGSALVPQALDRVECCSGV